MRLAFLSDIHGNLPALEAVLTDLKAMAPDALYVGGDLVNRCPWNPEIMAWWRESGSACVRGNHDWVVGILNTPENFPPFDDRQRFPDLWWTHAQLSPDDRRALRTLPLQLRLEFPHGPAIRLFHGQPDNLFVGIYEALSDAKISQILAPIAEEIVVCGHTHRSLNRRSTTWQVLNPGSVGLSYDGDPRAHYMLLDLVQGQWRPTLRQVAYNQQLVEQAFHSTGFGKAVGAVGTLYLRTVQDGHPWASDFGQWLKEQPAAIKQNRDRAVDLYLQHHGPGRWSFPYI